MVGVYASVAQLVEQGTENPRVVGSIPTGGTIFSELLGYSHCGSRREVILTGGTIRTASVVQMRV